MKTFMLLLNHPGESTFSIDLCPSSLCRFKVYNKVDFILTRSMSLQASCISDFLGEHRNRCFWGMKEKK